MQKKAFNRTRLAALGLIGVVTSALLISASGKLAFANLQAEDAAPVVLTHPSQGFADLVEQVRPAVVNISTSTTRIAARPGEAGPRFNDPNLAPFMQRFFRHDNRPATPTRSLGSGFIVSADGYVVTNHHVIDEADQIEVVLENGERYPATVIGSEQATDLALLKIETENKLPFVQFGDDSKSRVGDWIIAIGNPFGLGGTTTTGIISARGRNINAGPYDDFIQIDAPINRGNSGGPLFNLSGEVIGVNSVIYSPNGGNVGIGFAIPASQANSVIAQIRDTGRVERGWLGIHIQALDADIASGLGLDDTRGALVAKVQAGSPAERAGLRPGDVVVSFDGTDVEKLSQLPRLVANTKPGSQVDIGIMRNGRLQNLSARLNPKHQPLAATTESPDESIERALGLTLEPLDRNARRKLGIEDDINGALVSRVEPQSKAAHRGIRSDDIIRQVGGQRVESPRDVVDGVASARQSDQAVVLFRITREGNDRFVALRFG